MPLRPQRDEGTLSTIYLSGAQIFMSCHLSRLVRHGPAIAALAAAIIVLPAWKAAARGPENIADVAEQVIDAVVNISTSQKVDPHVAGMPDLPPGSPMEEFFDEFFKNHHGQGDHGVGFFQADAADAGGGPAHGPDILFGEADAHAVTGDEDDLVVAGGEFDINQFVA